MVNVMAMVLQQDVFQARLKRISAGGDNTMSQVYIGDGSTAKRQKRGDGKKGLNLAAKKKYLNAFMIGAISMIVGRLVLFHLVSQNGVYAEEALGEVGVIFAENLGVFAIAGAISLVAMLAKKISGQNAVLAVVAGFMLIMVGESRLLQAAPDLYGAIYSPSYAQAQLASLTDAG